MLVLTNSVFAGVRGKLDGGGCRSKRIRLCEELSLRRRVAVARPIPEQPPVIRIVLGVDERLARESGERSRRDILIGKDG